MIEGEEKAEQREAAGDARRRRQPSAKRGQDHQDEGVGDRTEMRAAEVAQQEEHGLEHREEHGFLSEEPRVPTAHGQREGEDRQARVAGPGGDA